MASSKKPARRERKNAKFTKKHPKLPINLHKHSSRTAWAKEKRELKALKNKI